MKRIIPILAISLAIVTSMTRCTMKETDDPNAKLIDEIVASMTLEQKAQYVVGTGMFMNIPIPEEYMVYAKPMLEQYGWMNEPESDQDTIYTNMVDHVRTYVPGTAGRTAEFPELGITCQVLSDGPAGLRLQAKATAFPIATLLASSWDTDLVRSVGETMGKEALEFGTDVILGPGVNLHRDPLCGRNFEYYSEDPLVTGKIGAAMVRGIQSNGVGTAVKHFAVNNQETNRTKSNSILGPRALRELYLKGFEIIVKEAQPWTIMSSYNLINGVYAPESHDLLTTILRDDWGFEGYVMTDWISGIDVVAQMKAGNDMIMPGRKEFIKTLISAVEEGKLEESVLDRNISRILGIMMKTPRYKEYNYSGPDLESHAQFARRAATEGMVLLKNEGQALPLTQDGSKVAAFGNAAYEIIIGGTGSGDVNEAYTISLREGLDNAGFEPDAELGVSYLAYMEEARANLGPSQNPIAALLGVSDPLTEMPVPKSLAQQAAASSDVALITVGRNAGEMVDRQAVEGDFYLTEVEKEMIINVSDAFHAAGKKTIVILNIAGVIETASWRDIPDAIMCAWHPGQEAGNSIVDVVSGKVNPSGKLASTFPVSYEDAPTAENFPGTAIEKEGQPESPSGPPLLEAIPMEVLYEEDIYVGYRYYNTFDVPVAYEFGYGLSYTDFEYTNLVIENPDFNGTLNFSVEVKNRGAVAGKEAVQVYISAPGEDMDKPAQELVAFGKTGLLQPGESQTLEFVINTADIASFDQESSSWVAEAGEYALKVGASSLKIKQAGTFSLSETMNAGTVSRSLLPQKEINSIYTKRENK